MRMWLCAGAMALLLVAASSPRQLLGDELQPRRRLAAAHQRPQSNEGPLAGRYLR